jgi:hypothetical protein
MSLDFTKRLATDIYSAVFSVVWSNSLATASTSCNVCQRLEPPWPILIYDFYVEGNGPLSCPGCELLYTIFEPIYKRTFQGNLHGKIDFREGKMYIRLCNTFSYVVYIGKGMSTTRVKPLPILIRISGEQCPLPYIPQGLANFGVEDQAAAAMVIKRWLDVCNNTHSKCRAGSDGPPPLLPTRVIEIQGPKQVFLRTVNVDSESLQYTCLSHCWGGIVPLRTTSKTLQTFQDTGIVWETLPRSFQDAVDMTERLGLRYIWIDSLCIIQDDIEDWRAEGSRMSRIFSGAYLTLAATSATGSDKGFYRARSARRVESTHSIPNQENGGRPYEIHVVETSEPSMEWQDLPLLKRAWVYQETWLTPRIIHFAKDMLHWECLECKAQETEIENSISACSSHRESWFDSFKNLFKKKIFGTSSHPKAVLEAYKAREEWYEIVKGYTRASLTFSKDKLPALQGVAKRVKSKRQCAYYAGLWEDELCMDLAWFLGTPTTSKITYRAPSWSWASTEGCVHYNTQLYMKAEASVVHVETVPAGKDPLGEVTAGTLVIRGLCLPAVVKLEAAQGNRKAHETLSVMGNNGPVKMQWQQDHKNSNLEDQSLTAVLLVSDNSLFQAYYLVLLPTKKDNRVYQRVGLAVWRNADNSNQYEQLENFDSIVLEHAKHNQGWEGCKEFREFSII